MMLYPAINELNELTDSRYTLVVLAAKRARDIIDGKPVLTEVEAERPVSLATNEIAEGQITFKRLSDEGFEAVENKETATDSVETIEIADLDKSAASDVQVEVENKNIESTEQDA